MQETIFVQICGHDLEDSIAKKNLSPNVLENQTRPQNFYYIARKSSICALWCTLFEYIPLGITGDILKSYTLSGAKNSNKIRVPSQLVTWIPYTVCGRTYLGVVYRKDRIY